MIDNYNDHCSSIQFVVNVNGAMEDLLQLGETQNTRNHEGTKWMGNKSAHVLGMLCGFEVIRLQASGLLVQ